MDRDNYKEQYLATLDVVGQQYQLALDAFNDADYEKAARILYTLLEAISDSPEFLLLLARCHLCLEEPLKALFTLKKCRTELSQDSEFLFLLGITYSSLFINELAIQAFREILEIGEVQDEEVYFALGQALFHHGYINEAVEVAKQGLEINPSWNKLRYLLGLTYLYQKDKHEALTILKQLKDCDSPFASDLFDLIDIDEDDLEVEKIEIIKAKREAKDHVLLSCQLLTYSETGRAVRELIDALRKDGDLAIAYTRLGCIFDDYGFLDEGLTLHKNAIEKDPYLAEAYNNIGDVFQVKGDIQQAIDSYIMALEIDPHLVQAHNSIGCLYDNIGDYEKGISHFKQALEIDPNREISWSNLGFSYRALGKIDDAIEAYRTVIKLYPESQCRIGLAQMYRELRRYADVKAELFEFLKIDSECLKAWLELALCYKELGESEKFYAAMEKAMALPARDPHELFAKAELMEIVDMEKAVDCWMQFLAVADHHFVEPSWVSHAKKRLTELAGITH